MNPTLANYWITLVCVVPVHDPPVCVQRQLQYYCLNHICDNLPVIYGAVSDCFESHVIRLSKRSDVFRLSKIVFHVRHYNKCVNYYYYIDYIELRAQR